MLTYSVFAKAFGIKSLVKKMYEIAQLNGDVSTTCFA